MSLTPAVVVPCGCCRALVEPSAAFFDAEIHAHVCEPCRVDLMQAKANLARSFSAPADGLPAMPINLRGCYHGHDAPDNHVTIPPPTEL